jgi:hypothetical protein
VTPERHVSDAQRAIEAREVRRDKAARYLPPPPEASREQPSGTAHYLAATLVVSAGPHPDAARVAPIHGRIIVAERVRRAAIELDRAMTGRRLGWRRAPDPRQRPRGTPCPICTAVCCTCDGDTAHMHYALDAITAHLRRRIPPPLNALDPLHGELEAANRDARRIAGVSDVHLVLKAPCPGCDSRDLVADCTSVNQADWSIRCRNRLCVCRGPGCGCGCAVRYPGKAHRWNARDGQWHDLAARLGITRAALLADILAPPRAARRARA